MKKRFFLIPLLILPVILALPAAAAKVTTITFGRWASVDEVRSFQVLIDKFEKANPYIKVRAEFLPWNAYWTKLKASIMTGTAYDVISLSHQNSAPYITKAALYDLGRIRGASLLLNEMHRGTRAPVMYQGRIYGMPVGVGVRALVYNKALFDRADIPYPDRSTPMGWEWFMKIGRMLTKTDANGRVTQYAANFDPLLIWEACVIQAGGSLVDNYTRPTRVTINAPAGIAGLQFLLDLHRNGVNVPMAEQWNGPWGTPDSALNTGGVAMVLTGPWSLPAMIDGKINFGTAPCFMGQKRATLGYVNFLGMSKSTKNVQAAWTFIRWLCSTAGQLEYTKTGDLPANAKAWATAKKQPAQYNTLIMDAFYNELPYVITGPMLPSEELKKVTDAAVQDLLQYRITPAEAAARIEREGNAAIGRIFGE